MENLIKEIGYFDRKQFTDELEKRLFDNSQNIRFPLEILPTRLQEIIRAETEAFGQHSDYLTVSKLSALATAVGNTYKIEVKNGWIESLCFYMALVGRPGINKSSALSLSFSPLDKKNKEQYKEYLSGCNEFEADPENKNKKYPPFIKDILADSTIEATIQQLSLNNRGVCIINDELAAFFNGIQRYSNGNDEQVYLSAWSGKTIHVDRVSKNSIRIDNPLINIIGTTQPAILEKLFLGKEDSGFMDRWLFCSPPDVEKSYWSDKELDPKYFQQYLEIVSKLSHLSFNSTSFGSLEPNHIRYSDKARSVIYAWQRKNTERANNSDLDIVKGITAKLEIYVHRFSLLLSLIEWACSDITTEPFNVGLKSADGAIKICEYFYNNAFRIRVLPPSERLVGDWKELFDFLPDDMEFSTSGFIDAASKLGISERSAKSWLKKHTGKLFAKLKHGVYSKL